jgi:hypothetical protein
VGLTLTAAQRSSLTNLFGDLQYQITQGNLGFNDVVGVLQLLIKAPQNLPAITQPAKPIPPRTSLFAKYNKYLKPLDVQLTRLKELNSTLPVYQRIPHGWFEAISTESYHVQSIEDLETFVVWRGTAPKSWCYPQNIIKQIYPATDDSIEKTNTVQLCFNSNAFDWNTLPLGIYRVRINLVAHWSPDITRSVNEVRSDASEKKQILASFEAALAYALQAPELIKLLDGVNLPCIDAAGLSFGYNYREVPCFEKSKAIGEVQFHSIMAAAEYTSSAAPILLGVPM